MLKYNWYFVYSIIFSFAQAIIPGCFQSAKGLPR